ncbi:radical SAM protein [Chryseobacterium sp. PBS4-4]|uniref:Radical SAM protein n=1 Tax=Chryseobacterium edaphi TaxID=2976532 RepID=A0ABT2W7H9_9FLAO|nr:radical SAM protein [Chryseobacterium edaphi]MCU7618163.1 radical SAM protein [Chryseobacterium edaphi]
MKINTIVLKVASRCNLNCSYCYVYNKGDETYKNKPKIFSIELNHILLKRILDYMNKYNINLYTIVFHGGEPLLAGIEYYKDFIRTYEEFFFATGKTINFVMQTNGTLLDKEFTQALFELDISIGISMDTTEATNSRYRVYHNNKSSYNEIKNGIDLCNEIIGNAGILSVINVEDTPIDTYSHLRSLNVNYANLLFPDENHDTILLNDTRGKIGKWLTEMFDLWFFDKDNDKPEIPLFSTLIKLILAIPDGNDIMGKGFGGTMIIETNGDIETNDTLRVCKSGITKSDYNIKNDALDSIKNIPLAELYYFAHHRLSQTCKDCILEDICAGGYLINRYSNKNGFNNESVYCQDIVKLVCHVQNIIAKETDRDLNLQPINVDEVLEDIENNKKTYNENKYLESF